MNKTLLDIINNSHEAVYALDAYIFNRESPQQKEDLLDDLRVISLKGNDNQKFVALTVISVNKPKYLEELSYELIENFDYENDEYIIKPIVNICSIVKKQQHIEYMERILDYALKRNKEYLAEVVLRSIISTDYWKNVINNILQVVSDSDELTVVDFLAFFQYKRGKKEYRSLLEFLSKEDRKKVRSYKKEISARLKNAYEALDKIDK